MNIFYRIALFAILAASLQACQPGGWPTPAPDFADTPSRQDLTTVAQKALRDIQQLSIDENLEYCGVILLKGETDELVASNSIAGGPGWCQLPEVRQIDGFEVGDIIVADFHTHAGYDSRADSEVPSVTDMIGNKELGIPGFVATPGGRLWWVEADGEFAEQVCGVRCLPHDDSFEPETGIWEVEKSYTLREMMRRQS